jgi:hypothetical protein
MHNFLKKILGTGKPAPSVTLAFDAVPGWITERESAAKAALVAGTREPMAEIRNGMATLQLIMNNIAGAEHDEAIHPRLRTIAKNSLPQFVRAMKVSLAKDLPEDPVAFYPLAAECLKNCLHNTRGQGKYLQAIFPDEMKTVRQGIDILGRGINTINPLLGEYRKEMADLAAARASFESIAGMKSDLAASEEKVKRSNARIGEIRDRLEAIDREKNALTQDPRRLEVDEQEKMIDDLSRQRDTVSRTYSALSMTASHVFRKAEKIATKQRHPPEIALLNSAMEILSDHEIPDPGRLDEILAAACPVTEKLIAEGEIVLKNKEERAIFSDTPRFRQEIRGAGASLRELEEKVGKAESARSAHPLVTKTQSLEREKTQLAAMREKEESGLSDLQEWQEKTKKQIPVLLQQLKEKIAGMSRDNVQLQVPDIPLP